MTTESTNVAAVLALVGNQDHEAIEADLPVPPNGASPRAQAAWYKTLEAMELETVAEWRLLEAIVDTITQYDLVQTRWTAEGCPTTSTGSMGQECEAPALGTMKALRTSEAALWKQLNLPTSNSETKRRAGRPTRAQHGGKWGAI